MAGNIVVTSTGIISSLGYGIQAQLTALSLNKAGLKYPVHLKTKHAADFIVGEVDYSNDALARLSGLPDNNKGYTRTTLLALAAMQNILEQTDISLLQQSQLALINANTVGGMCSVEDMYLDFVSDKTEGNFIRYIDTLDCAESTLNIAAHFNLKVHTATISTACSSSANAVIVGARMIKAGLVDKAICGGCDALSRFTLNGFHALKNVDKEPSRPFDETRMGLNLGEGAGYLLLEREEDAIARGANILAVLKGYSNTNDAYHPTAPSPDGSGAYNTMQLALSGAGLAASEISYINAHGTATLNNDSAEGKAIEKLFDNSVLFSSTKPFTGHTLAAAGSIEAIFSILCLQHQTAWSNLNFTTQMNDIYIAPITKVTPTVVNHVLSNSFGFGGNNVSLIFSRS